MFKTARCSSEGRQIYLTKNRSPIDLTKKTVVTLKEGRAIGKRRLKG